MPVVAMCYSSESRFSRFLHNVYKKRTFKDKFCFKILKLRKIPLKKTTSNFAKPCSGFKYFNRIYNIWFSLVADIIIFRQHIFMTSYKAISFRWIEKNQRSMIIKEDTGTVLVFRMLFFLPYQISVKSG